MQSEAKRANMQLQVSVYLWSFNSTQAKKQSSVEDLIEDTMKIQWV